MKIIGILVISAFVHLTPPAGECVELRIATQYDSLPLPKTEVMIWKQAPHLDSGRPDYRMSTDHDGKGAITLPEGGYFLAAEKNVDGALLAGFPGLNPFVLDKGAAVVISLVRFDRQYLKKTVTAGVSGAVTLKGIPIADVNVLFYLDLTTELKGPAYLVAVTDEQGRFNADPGPGSYYVVFRKKMRVEFGPAEPGDLTGVLPSFPLTVPADGTGFHMKAELLKIPSKMKDTISATSVSLSGTVKEGSARPLAGVYVVAYESDTLLGKPVSVSAPTDAVGRFRLFVKRHGKYSIAVRKSLGDTPQPDERVYTHGLVDTKTAGELQIVITDSR